MLVGPAGTAMLRSIVSVAGSTSTTWLSTASATHSCPPARTMATGRPDSGTECSTLPVAGSKRSSRLRRSSVTQPTPPCSTTADAAGSVSNTCDDSRGPPAVPCDDAGFDEEVRTSGSVMAAITITSTANAAHAARRRRRSRRWPLPPRRRWASCVRCARACLLCSSRRWRRFFWATGVPASGACVPGVRAPGTPARRRCPCPPRAPGPGSGAPRSPRRSR